MLNNIKKNLRRKRYNKTTIINSKIFFLKMEPPFSLECLLKCNNKAPIYSINNLLLNLKKKKEESNNKEKNKKREIKEYNA